MPTDGYITVPVRTDYIKPGEGLSEIVNRAGELVTDGDFLVVSETPISIAQGNLVDESEFEASRTAIILADLWSKYIWGHILGPLFGIKERTLRNLRNLPPEARNHKEVVLRYYGLKHALKPASEAGIDLSNVPGTYVSLLPENPVSAAKSIAEGILRESGADVTVVVIDTDATYRILGRYFTSLPIAAPGIISDTGFMGYIAGRFSRKRWPTPLASSKPATPEVLLEVASIAEGYHERYSNRKTVYDMASELGSEPETVTVEMLSSLEHVPAVIVRPPLR
ncbi:coenzyme F420-0:L-glutamate ligase [Methanothermobacter sp. K4]|uniref:coenzyme F420-0:L-glutamate ligase n=1 Tax=Methanothermobacter sp. K4 TaxID=2913262 RepID=UPI001EDBABDC|nr:coenzyme F420-0:L-glutamate ligase [Methanothermobacter sp. K4]MCG2827669.1 coenzyme F420-0:L-glutamate ligase [Methanothermobacter sp. K4]